MSTGLTDVHKALVNKAALLEQQVNSLNQRLKSANEDRFARSIERAELARELDEKYGILLMPVKGKEGNLTQIKEIK